MIIIERLHSKAYLPEVLNKINMKYINSIHELKLLLSGKYYINTNMY